MQTENNKATEKVESTVSEETRQETETQAQLVANVVEVAFNIGIHYPVVT